MLSRFAPLVSDGALQRNKRTTPDCGPVPRQTPARPAAIPQCCFVNGSVSLNCVLDL